MFEHKKSHIPAGLEMYFSREISEKFAELEQNEKNFAVAEIVDRLLMEKVSTTTGPLRVAELGGGAHPDRYNSFFTELLHRSGSHVDWVDVSPFMLEIARKYLVADRAPIISFVEQDMLGYLTKQPDASLDVVIMKYTIDHVADLQKLFALLATKLKHRGVLIATLGVLNPELRSFSTNARFLYNGEQFPDNETRMLTDGDSFTVKFFRESGNPAAGYLEGAETTKYFHSAEKIKTVAGDIGLSMQLGDWKQFLAEPKQGGIKMNQDIMILTRN